ncbi:hypothetical protein CTheo_7194 [Ceratobasidium theobromae]|uniref:Uncharacterized protein n=1 Tax=Ceratobasidium theobromae TaxID=1582974 RepID=A0A5N5QD34_9AGAM|nr:hypothetical protein CTheo_7194 [Ceratobasidium theobromae]
MSAISHTSHAETNPRPSTSQSHLHSQLVTPTPVGQSYTSQQTLQPPISRPPISKESPKKKEGKISVSA